jgi:hypothetical protein
MDGNIEERRFMPIHPAWYSFIKYCQNMRSGKIEKIKIQNGLPIMAEEVKSEVRFDE